MQRQIKCSFKLFWLFIFTVSFSIVKAQVLKRQLVGKQCILSFNLVLTALGDGSTSIQDLEVTFLF